jgi:hypothetical protein
LQIATARQSAAANYPDPILTNPNGWRVGTKAAATMNIVTPTTEEVLLRNQADANSKLAPAIAMAGTSALTTADTVGFTTAEATGRPGLQYGVTLAKADQQLVNLSK